MKKTALIFGISGQDGSYLSQLLLNKGYEVIGTSRDATLASFGNLRRFGILDKIKVESVSLHDFRSVLQVLNKFRPDEVYNLAGQSSVALSFDQPVETFESVSVAVLNLLEAIRFLKLDTRLYNASSVECFGNTFGKEATEDTAFKPRSPYAVAKSAAFWQVSNYREAYDMYACSGILFNHESPLRPSRFVTKKIVHSACKIYKGLNEKLQLGDLSVQRDWGWAPEYVDAMWRILQQSEPDDFIVATGQTNSLEYFTEAVFKSLNMDWREHVDQSPGLIRPTDIQTSKADPRKAENVLGWKAKYRLDDVVKMLIEAELEQLD